MIETRLDIFSSLTMSHPSEEEFERYLFHSIRERLPSLLPLLPLERRRELERLE
jgi:hypothetical protein